MGSYTEQEEREMQETTQQDPRECDGTLASHAEGGRCNQLQHTEGGHL